MTKSSRFQKGLAAIIPSIYADLRIARPSGEAPAGNPAGCTRATIRHRPAQPPPRTSSDTHWCPHRDSIPLTDISECIDVYWLFRTFVAWHEAIRRLVSPIAIPSQATRTECHERNAEARRSLHLKG